MSIIIFPGQYPREARLILQTNQRAHASPFGGSEQVVDMLNDRWLASCTFPAAKLKNAAPLEAFLASMRGQTNTVGIWHFARPIPLGSLRGLPTLASNAAQGAAVVTLQTSAGATLLEGDLIGISGLLLMVQTNALANGAGVMTVPIVNRLRIALALGAAVSWDRPLVQCRMVGNSGVNYFPGQTAPVQCDFAEAIA